MLAILVRLWVTHGSLKSHLQPTDTCAIHVQRTFMVHSWFVDSLSDLGTNPLSYLPNINSQSYESNTNHSSVRVCIDDICRLQNY